MIKETVIYQNEKSCNTSWVRLYMAGSIEQAKVIIAKWVYKNSWCVNISPCDYIYHGGIEDGFMVEAISYPRFPDDPILERMELLAEELIVELAQDSFSIMTPTQTKWKSRRLGS